MKLSKTLLSIVCTLGALRASSLQAADLIHATEVWTGEWKMKATKTPVFIALTASVLAAAAPAFTSSAYAASQKDNVVDGQLFPQGRTPAKIENHNYPTTYYPNTELLGPEEMRITALGTGMPNPTKSQASISYLVELGNGDKFVFDIGYGSMANMFALRPDFAKVDKVFASHLHTDHVGDFASLLIGGWLTQLPL